jgi:hypothetical protein
VFGKVTFAGEVTFESVSVLKRTPLQPVDVAFRHAYQDGRALEVVFVLPVGIFTGPGTYACGSEVGKTETQSAYCTLKVNYTVDGTTSCHWSSYGYEVAPGVFGAVPNCTLTVSATSPLVTGSVSCPSLPFASAQGLPVDAGSVVSVTGNWEYLP